jgi:hypothetical protein
VSQFRVHKHNLCERSNFFKAAVSTDRWLEGQKKLVRLPDVAPKTFRAYVHWAYTGKISPEILWREAEVEVPAKQFAYLSLYLLAEFLDDTDIRAEILAILISRMTVWDCLPGHVMYKMIWDGTPKGSPLRTVVCEWLVRRQSRPNFADNVGSFPKELLEEIAVLLMQRASSNPNGVETLEVLAARVRAQLLSN